MYCTNCGNKLDKEDKYCSSCGKKAVKGNKKESVKESIEPEKGIDETKGMAVLSYLGILAFIPYIWGPNTKFVKFHARQGMNLLLIWVGYSILYNLLILVRIPVYTGRWYVSTVTPWYIYLFLSLAGLFVITLSIIGISNVIKGEEKEIPFVNKIKIIK